LRNNILLSEIELVDTGPSELPQALESGQVDAIVIWEPHADLARQLLGDAAIQLPSADIHRTTFNFVVMEEFTQTSPDVLVSFLRAIDKATAFVADHETESQAIVAEKLKLEKDAVTRFWPDFTFELSLDQSLIVTLEAEARWAMRNKLTTGSQVPNYLDYIYSAALEDVNPETIGIIR
jgi:NitT/TauT family transport system substrate-binding protein